jgi:predicted component of type VI protein secretion system
MAREPDDMVLPMLREIRSELHQLRQQMDKLESGQKTIRQALTADTMISKFVTGDFEERIFDLERKVEVLIKGK